MEPQQNQETKKPLTISTPAAIITAGVFIALGLIFSGRSLLPASQKKGVEQAPTTTTPSKETSLRPDDHIRGDLTKAEIVIVEYSDSDCPYCQRFHNTMNEVLKKYGTKVAWVYRHFPLSIHPNAENEAIALECVSTLGGNDAFWKYLDQLVDITVTPSQSAAILTTTATKIGINEKAFTSCLSNPAIAKKVAEQATEAQSLGAQGTPYNIALAKDGTQVVIAGAYPLEEMIKTIDRLLK
jgi:protein-disulfide isomerase